jgi:hypothetical protein
LNLMNESINWRNLSGETDLGVLVTYPFSDGSDR